MSGCGGKGDDLGAPPWDMVRATALVGKYVLPINEQQMHGIIASVDPTAGIVVELKGERAGETTTLPPHLPAFEDAAPGAYELNETGEVVNDPDLTTMWKIVRPAN